MSFFVGLGLGLVFGIVMNDMIVEGNWHREAQKHGHAEYYLDENNNRQWRWKEAR